MEFLTSWSILEALKYETIYPSFHVIENAILKREQNWPFDMSDSRGIE
jgi:hypothetical protein